MPHFLTKRRVKDGEGKGVSGLSRGGPAVLHLLARRALTEHLAEVPFELAERLARVARPDRHPSQHLPSPLLPKRIAARYRMGDEGNAGAQKSPSPSTSVGCRRSLTLAELIRETAGVGVADRPAVAVSGSALDAAAARSADADRSLPRRGVRQ